MKQAPNNPRSNALIAGTTDALVADAISRSGYPLQVIVATLLRDQMMIHEEWAYLDRDTKELRALDIRAGVALYNRRDQPRIRPHLDLLIECKQSELPYVFFLSSQNRWTPDFPVFAGLAHRTIEINTDDDRSTWSLGAVRALGLEADTFLTTEPSHCATFSKCVRKGKALDLSGTEPYHAIVLPLVKAMGHLQVSEAPPKTAYYFDLHIGVAVAVLDAPMIAVEVTPTGNELTLTPWARVIRHEYLDGRERRDHSRWFAIDIVHKDFLREYIDRHVMPFAQRIAQRALRHQEELATGLAFASGMGKDSWTNIEERLRPRKEPARRRHKD
jgi:hypothetical protein